MSFYSKSTNIAPTVTVVLRIVNSTLFAGMRDTSFASFISMKRKDSIDGKWRLTLLKNLWRLETSPARRPFKLCWRLLPVRSYISLSHWLKNHIIRSKRLRLAFMHVIVINWPYRNKKYFSWIWNIKCNTIEAGLWVYRLLWNLLPNSRSHNSLSSMFTNIFAE